MVEKAEKPLEFHIKCKGRNFQGKESLEKAVDAIVNIIQIPNSNIISSYVNCMYALGENGQICHASYLNMHIFDKNWGKISCPYKVNIPSDLEKLEGMKKKELVYF